MTKGAKTGPARTDDKVVRIGMELAGLWRRFNELDGVKTDEANSAHDNYRKSEMRNIEDRIRVLRGILTTTPATSVTGALVQISEIVTLTDIAAGCVDGLEDKDARAIQRLCFSAMKAISATVPEATVQALDVMEEHLNPWVPYEKRLAMIGEAVTIA